jgi:methionine-rich copper-binding protein CopC
MRRPAALLLAVASLLAVVVATPGPAYAHGRLVLSTPANGATLDAPTDSVSLAFTEKLPPFAHLTVTTPSGARVDQPWSHAAPFRLTTPVREYQLVDGTWQPREFHAGFPVQVPMAFWPERGQYVVRYQSVATDGEEVEGEVRFGYRGAIIPAPPGWRAPTDQPAAELLAAAGKVRDDIQATATTATARATDGRGPWPWLVPVLLVAAVAGLVALLVTGPSARARRAGRKRTG